MAVASDLELVGREEELRRLRDFVDALRQGATAAVIRGEAGIGKTVLWGATIEAAKHADVSVLVTRCAEVEMPLALGAVADLLDPVFHEVADELFEPQRRLLASAIGVAPHSSDAPDRTALPRAFLAYLRVLAGRGPVLVAIDDAQWLDPASLRTIAYAARRLADEPVGLVTTQRGDTGDALGLGEAFAHRFAEIRVGPLSLGALHHLIRARLGARIPRPTVARLHESSGGNPMFALEFARSLAEQDRPQLGPMQIPASLHDLIRARIQRYPQGIRDLLATTAAAERPTPSLLEEVDGLTPGLLERAIDVGAVAIGDDGIVRFTHPLLASAIYSEASPAQRRSVHARLAHLASDTEERARHLALASNVPDEAVAALLEEAADRAFSRGAPESAAELAQEAVRRTPPTDLTNTNERALRVAVYLGASGRGSDSALWLDRILAGGATGPPRARALLLRVAIVEHDVEAGGSALAEALEHVGDDLALRARLLLQTSSYHLFRNDLAASEDASRQALAAAEKAEDPALVAAALATVADRAHLARHPDDGLLERAIALADVHGMPPVYPTLDELHARRLLRTGDLAGSRKLVESELGMAVRAGVEPDRYRMLRELVDIEWRAGNWKIAAKHLDEAWELAVDDGADPWSEAELQARRGRLAALSGEVDDARRLLADGIASAEAMHWSHLAAMNQWALGFLELSLEEPTRAWQALQDVPRTPTWGRLEVVEAVADTVETLVALGRLRAADDLTVTLQEEARHGHLWAAPALLRCSALLLLARGDAVGAAGVADEAAAGFEAAGFPLDHGRALLVAGDALRRVGERRRAGEKLESAGQIFAKLGALLWQARAEKELSRARPRPRHDGELTSAERRVAGLVAEGRTNREVAAQLFITTGTVEVHLTRIYRKLGVRSRTELARLASEGTRALGDSNP